MKKTITIVLTALIAAPAAFWLFGNSIIWLGQNNSAWIREEMWGTSYFGNRSENLQGFELLYIKSLNNGSSKDQQLITHVVKNKCYDSSWKCSAIMTSGANLLIDNNDDRPGLRGAIEAYERIRGKCSIMYESAVIGYHLRKLSAESPPNKKHKAATLLNKIKGNGGIMTDLRTSACKKLALEKPEYFTTYALLVAKLMENAGGMATYGAVYIESLDK